MSEAPAGSASSVNSAGIYFSANDVVYDWVVTFLESVRNYNPDLPVILLPFDERMDRLTKLAPRYRVTIHNDAAFEELDDMGRQVVRGEISHGHHWFRRLATFWGPFDHFLSLDSDIVLLSDPAQMLRAIRESEMDLLHCDCALGQVYLPGEFRRQMVRRGARGFNAGTWGSRRGLFTFDEFRQYFGQALKVLPSLNSRNGDQPFINYCCDMKPVKYAPFSEFIPNASPQAWARIGELYRRGDRYYHWDHGGQDHNKRILLLHWAGFKANPAMPHANIYLRFRLRPLPLLDRALKRLSWWLRGFFYRGKDRLNRNRHVNTLYHTLRVRLRGGELPQPLRIVRDETSTGSDRASGGVLR
jgi:hypothetical protein